MCERSGQGLSIPESGILFLPAEGLDGRGKSRRVDCMAVLLLHAIDFEEARALFGSGDERLCARILKNVPTVGEAARTLSRAITALVCGTEGERLSGARPFEKRAVR